MIKILFVDDDNFVLSSLSRMLREESVAASFELEPKAALTLIKNNKFDIVFVDQKMPSMSGIEFLNQPIVKQSGIITVLMSGGSSRLQPHSDDYQYYLAKPFTKQQLLSTIAMIHSDTLN
jgi:two-component SAPR family response regulator